MAIPRACSPGALTTSAGATSDVGSYAITLGSLSAGGNYTIAYTGANLSVTARPITVTAASLSRIYGDANPVFTYSIGGAGLVNGDTLSGSLASAAIATSDVGGYAILQGSLTAGSNYALSYTPGTLTVTARSLSATIAADDKVYDGTDTATGSVLGLSGVLFADDVALDGTGSFAFLNPNAGANKAVVVSGLSLAGADAGNYVLSATAATSASITPATLSVTADALSRLYGDANPDAELQL